MTPQFVVNKLLGESASLDLEAICKRYLIALWKRWKVKYPDEPDLDNPEYMRSEFERYAYLAWAISKDTVIDNARWTPIPASAIKCSTQVSRCYYNALDFVMKNGTQFGELAFCLAIDRASLEKADAWSRTPTELAPRLADVTAHAVVLTPDRRVIDPTLGRDIEGDILVYEIVPESAWRTFHHADGDPKHDARDFFDRYIMPRIEKVKIEDFGAWLTS